MITSNIEFKGLHVTHICKPKLKHSYINITKEGVILKTPKVSSYYIDELLSSKERWIRKKLLTFEQKTQIDKTITDEKLAKDYMQSRIELFAKKMGLIYSELKFRRMKRRWGSCSSQKKITLNLYLYNTGKELTDYVIVHELAHLVHMNHSKQFHDVVCFYMPEAKELEKKLKAICLS